MNHCVTPGCGARCLNHNNVHCLRCQTARLLDGKRYDTPAMKRWKARRDAQRVERTKR